LQEYARAISIKSALQQQQTQAQLAPLQIQGAQQENQMRGLQLQDQLLWRKVASDPAVDWSKPEAMTNAVNSFVQQGGSPMLAQQVRMGQVDYLSKIATMNETQFKTQQARQDDLVGRAKSVSDEPDPVQRQNLWTQHVGELKQNGIDTSSLPAQVPDPQTLTATLNHLLSQKAQTEYYAAQVRDNPTLGKAFRDVNSSDPNVAAKAKAFIAAQLDYDAANAKTSAAARVEAETSPQAIAGAASKAAAVGQAEIPSRVAAGVQTEVGRAQAMAPTLEQATKTTISGRKYLDLTDLKGPEAQLLTKQALAAGIPVADKDTANVLTEIDTAKQNLQSMLAPIAKKLAATPGSRFWVAPGNTLGKFMQTDPDLASVGTYRNAAIQTMRAVAGSRGLRINRAEVQLAIDNDIPQLTDTLPTAQARIRDLMTFLNNSESAHLTQNRQTGATAQPGAQQQPSGWGAKFGGKQIQGVQQ
jgi:hypothetical protein